MNKCTFPKIALIYDRYKKASPEKKASVELRITYNCKQKYISTGIMLYPSQWKDNEVVEVIQAQTLNQHITKLISDIRQVLMNMQDNGGIDLNAIQGELERRNNRGMGFIDFCKRRAEIRKYGKAKDTQERYDRFIRLFSAWGRINSFADITDSNIIEYDKYLVGKGMGTYSKWNNYHRFLNSFIMDAIDAGYVKRNPYKWISIERDKKSHGLKRCLTPEEFQRMKRVDLPTESLRRVRDLFVFQTYTCLSYSDLRLFTLWDIHEIDGMSVYVGKRRKTGVRFTVPILEPALQILRKYDGKLPLISNVKYNEYLKVVAQAAGIDKPVSTHWARHTGATMLLNSGIPMQIVSRICGHSSTRITEQVYAKLLDETVVKAIKGLNL